MYIRKPIKISRIPVMIPRFLKPNINNPYGYIYLTTNKINNIKYIGQHKSISFDNSYKGSGDYITKAIKKYGKENFISEPIDWAESREELNQKEIWWIDFFDASNSKDWYNISKGGDGGPVLFGEDNPVSKEVYQFDMKNNLVKKYVNRAEVEKFGFKPSKISAICNRNKRELNTTFYFKGFVFSDTKNYKFKENLEEVLEVSKTEKRCLTEATKQKIAKKSKLFRHTEESKEKIRQAHIGTKLSKETREKISKSHKGKMLGKNNPNYGGKAMTKEHYKSHSEFMKGKHMSPKTEFTSENSSGANNSQAKAVVRLSPNGELLQIYGYLGEVRKDPQFPSEEGVRACCKGRKEKYKGYKWMYLEDYNKMKGVK